jgi:hypothetical protein
MDEQPARFPTVREAGFAWRDRTTGEPSQALDDWLIVGTFSQRISERCNGWTILEQLQHFFGEECVRWTRLAPGGDVLLVVDPRNTGAVKLANRYADKLSEGVDVLDPERYQAQVSAHAERLWTGLELTQRMALLEEQGLPANLARKSDLPQAIRACLEAHVVDTCDGADPMVALFTIEHEREKITALYIRG